MTQPIEPVITVTRPTPEFLRIKGVIRSTRAKRMAEQAVRLGTEAYWLDAGEKRDLLAHRAKARMDWAAEAEKALLKREHRKAQAAARKRARMQRSKAR